MTNFLYAVVLMELLTVSLVKSSYKYHYLDILVIPFFPTPLLSLLYVQCNLPTTPGNVIVLGHKLLRLVPAQLYPNG